MIKWESLPQNMQTAEVRAYYDILKKKKISLAFKRLFDILTAVAALIILSPAIGVIAVLIKIDSRGRVIFRQKRVTKYERTFYIYKFRTMVENAESIGTQVTVNDDPRVTRIGRILRRYRLDEILQLLNIIKGDMSFVGTRPEVEKYVDRYTDKMRATLLLPAGVTSLASICYKDEEKLLAKTDNADRTYIEDILPSKMNYNLGYLKQFNFFYDLKLMIMTVLAMLGKEYTAKISEEVKEVELNA